MKYTDREVQAPLCCISTTSSLENKTGSWRFARPVFVDRFSPCNQQCPAGEDIAGYMYLAGQGRFEDAWRLIMKENPFPAIMGRVCYHACEKTCNRNEHDEPVAIHTVERFIGEYALAHNLKVELDRPEIDRKIAIVGAGPAGLSAAYHLRLIGYSATVYDSKELPGGLMRYGIPSYRLPEDIRDGEISRLSDIGIEFKMGVKVGSDVNWEMISNGFDAFLVAIGAYQETELNLRGLDKKGVYHALEFLNEVNLRKWPIIGKRTVVIGGGNSALDCARVSRRLGAEVTTVYRRSEAEMPAQPEEVEMAREEGVRFVFLSSPAEIYGQEKVTGIKLAKMKLGEPDSTGRRSPLPTGETLDMDCETLILAIGESCIVEDLPSFLQTESKVVDTDDLGRTSASKCFACGDIIDIPHTVTHAIGSGKRAVVAIDRYLRGTEDGEEAAEPFKWGETGNFCLAGLDGLSLFPRRNPMLEVVAYSDLNSFYFDHRSRTTRHVLPAKERIKSFEEVVSSPTEEEALWEAKRCFNCGSCTDCGNCFIFCPDCSIKKDADGHGYLVDLDYCKGCGICVQECPRGAMKMESME
jgi:NADPH-dependent glutamate synthase beta subunit-like oxidoreductase/Pyruvate/2-oxoacid:ferredoxin oxidoreductase delta subunit